jgi:hypothetical protein
MKTFHLIASSLFVILGQASHAGGPDIEMPKARIENIVHDHRGTVVTVTGTVKLFVAKTEQDDPKGGNAKWVTLAMKSGEIRYLGDELHALSASGSEKYFQRLNKLKGTEQLLQMWGTDTTIAGGHVTHITARLVSALLPERRERRFASDRLEQLSEEPKPK